MESERWCVSKWLSSESDGTKWNVWLIQHARERTCVPSSGALGPLLFLLATACPYFSLSTGSKTITTDSAGELQCAALSARNNLCVGKPIFEKIRYRESGISEVDVDTRIQSQPINMIPNFHIAIFCGWNQQLGSRQ